MKDKTKEILEKFGVTVLDHPVVGTVISGGPASYLGRVSLITYNGKLAVRFNDLPILSYEQTVEEAERLRNILLIIQIVSVLHPEDVY